MRKHRDWRKNYRYVGYSAKHIEATVGKGKSVHKILTPQVKIRIERSKRTPKEEAEIARWWEGTKGGIRR